ncbi:hypothetical protein F183_A14520 [Bryobacterales bacterium F-183]|nr:hypothetical protein F183_A14520 [Bryobacterales bacterium F-183]
MLFVTVLNAAAADICVAVVDPTAAAIPDADVKVVTVKDGKAKTARTDINGKVCVTRLSYEKYFVEVRKEGFIPMRYEVHTRKKIVVTLPFTMLIDPSIFEDMKPGRLYL